VAGTACAWSHETCARRVAADPVIIDRVRPLVPGALASNLAAARQAVGTRCLVVATILRPAIGGVTDAGLNAAVRRLADESPTVHVVDWRRVATSRAGLLYPDGIHARPEGYDLRGRLVARAVKSCLGVGAQGLPPPASTTPQSADPPRLEPAAAEPEAPAVVLPRLEAPAGFAAVGEVFDRAADLLAAAGRDVRQAAGAEIPEPVLGAPE
jgi:hypothetical protein